MVTLICPAPSNVPESLLSRFDAFHKRLQTADQSQANFDRSIGCEVRLAFQLQAAGYQRLLGVYPDQSLWELKLRRLMMRPAIEPLLYSHRESFSTSGFNKASLLNLATVMLGRPVANSQVQMGFSGFNSKVLFEPVALAQLWYDKVLEIRSDPTASHLWPYFAFEQIVLSHPLTDGNGRLARAFLQGALCETLGLKNIIPPVSPIMCFYGRRLVQGSIVLTRKHDWSSTLTLLAEIIDRCCQYLESIIEVKTL